MPHLYKFRDGLIVNLDEIKCIMVRYKGTLDKYAHLHFTNTESRSYIIIDKNTYDELVEKCERYAS